jgi:tetratricopeptide (TPR) repeat protein
MRALPGRWATPVLALALAAASAACGGSGDTMPEPARRRDPAVEGFWANFRAASAARGAGDLERAAGLYRAALAAYPEHGDSLYYLGHFRYGRNEVAGANLLFERLAAVQPVRLRSWQQLSLARGQNRPGWVGNLDGAATAAERAIDLVRDESLNHELMARWAAYGGDMGAARRSLTTALGHNSASAAAHRLQDWIATPMPSDGGVVETVTGLGASTPVAIDLDGDGRADLRMMPAQGATPPLIATTPSSAWVLPGNAALPAWQAAAADGPHAVPTRAALARGPYGERVIVVGGGDAPVRVFAPARDGFGAVNNVELPAPRADPLVAAADFDGDGIDDLVLGNVALEPDAEALGARLLTGLPDGSWQLPGEFLQGPISQMLAADLDADGDPDLVVGRTVQATPTGDGGGGAATAESTSRATEIEFLYNRDGVLEPEPGPTVLGELRDIVVSDLDGDGHPDLFLATGSWSPEESTQDAVWLGSRAGFSDATDRIGSVALGTTFRAWPRDGGVLALRAGDVPAAPPQLVTIQIR